MDAGLKISLPGFDVKTATPEQCTIDSDYPTPKIRTDASPAHFGYFTYTFASNPTVNATLNLKTVAHGYGHTPIMICYYQQTNVDYQTGFKVLPWFYTSSNAYLYVLAYTDGTNFKIDFHRGTDGDFLDATDFTGLTFNFKFYIFAETGA